MVGSKHTVTLRPAPFVAAAATGPAAPHKGFKPACVGASERIPDWTVLEHRTRPTEYNLFTAPDGKANSSNPLIPVEVANHEWLQAMGFLPRQN